MKKYATKFPNLYTYFIGITLFAFSLMMSVFLNRGFLKDYFPYTASILLAISTWVLVRRENRSLNEIGFNLKLKKLLLLPLGLLIAAITFLIAKYLRAIILDETFNLSYQIDYRSIVFSLYFILPTVAVEEFLHRGYLFKKTIEISSKVNANIIFSILFTLIHVADSTVVENPGMLVLLLISIPVGHLLFATSFIKTGSIFFPIGLHLGNNWATRHLVSINSEGNSIFFVTDSATFDTWTGFIAFLLAWNSIYLLVTYLIWKWDKFFTTKL